MFFSVSTIYLLGYQVSFNEIRPDSARLQPLRDIPPPEILKLQKKIVGLFAYYSKWIPNFSEKSKQLSSNTTFLLPQLAIEAFKALKQEIEHSVVAGIDEPRSFVIKTDASDFAIAATRNQVGRPVAFFSRGRNRNELGHSSVQKEACSTVESIRHWGHYLTSKQFTLIMDQNSVRFMFDKTRSSKFKNERLIDGALNWVVTILTSNIVQGEIMSLLTLSLDCFVQLSLLNTSISCMTPYVILE